MNQARKAFKEYPALQVRLDLLGLKGQRELKARKVPLVLQVLRELLVLRVSKVLLVSLAPSDRRVQLELTVQMAL